MKKSLAHVDKGLYGEMIEMTALANPDLPVEFVSDLLDAIKRNELSNFEFEGSENAD